MKNDFKFYQKLPTHNFSLQDLLGEKGLFEVVPADWYVIVADIQNSTKAVDEGLHHDVNLIATGSIIAVLNKVKQQYSKLEIPYFFGGDGATFLVPGVLLEPLRETLHNYRRHVQQTFGLLLKIGVLSVAEVYTDEIQLLIAKLKLNHYLTIPVVLGNGLKHAEAMVKARFNEEEEDAEIRPVDLTGMECRWNEIAPPQEEERILCLLVNCPDESRQAKVYQAVIKEIDRIFGRLDERQPISEGRLKLNLKMAKLSREMYARLGKYDLLYLMKSWLRSFVGRFYFSMYEEGKTYLYKVSQLSNTLMIDGNINSVISGTEHSINELIHFLEKQEKTGDLTYGVHITHSSIMSCYVLDLKKNHVHFVDGTEGGYTTAAKMFKAKLSGGVF